MTPLPSHQNTNTPIHLPDHSQPADHFVWTQPDLPEKGLAFGRPVVEILEEFADKLLTLEKSLQPIQGLDTSRLNLMGQNTPLTLKVLLQKILDRLPGKSASGVATGTVTPLPVLLPAADSTNLLGVEECLQTLDANGDPNEHLSVQDYISVIAKRLCKNVDEVAQVSKVNERILKLLDAHSPAANAIADLVSFQLLRGTNQKYTMVEAFGYVEQILVNHTQALGVKGALENAAILQNEIGLDVQLSGTQLVKQLPGWKASGLSVPDQLNNLWVALRDVRTYLQSLSDNPANPVPSTFVLDYDLEFTTDRRQVTLRTLGFSKIPTNAKPCTTASLAVTDSLGTQLFDVDLITITQSSAGIVLDLAGKGIRVNDNLAFKLTACLLIDGKEVVKTQTKTVIADCVKPTVGEVVTLLQESTQLGIGWSAPFDVQPQSYRTTLYENGVRKEEVTGTATTAGFANLKPQTVYVAHIEAMYACGVSETVLYSLQTAAPSATTIMASFTNSTDKTKAFMKVRINNGSELEIFKDIISNLPAVEGDTATITVFTGEPSADQELFGQLSVNGILFKQINARDNGQNHTWQLPVTANNNFDWNLMAR